MKSLRIISVLLILIILACLPMVVEKESTITLLILIYLYVVLATSWNILGGYTGQTSLGHAAFFGLGSIAARMLWTNGILPIFPSVLAGGLLAVVFALIIGAPAFRLKGVYFVIGTLALAQILYVTVGNLFPQITNLPLEDLVAYDFTPRYYAILGLAVLAVGCAYLLSNSKLGLGMMAVREEEDAAESLGVSALKHKLLALGISAFFTGLAGGVFAYYHVGYYYQYPFQAPWSLDMLTMVYIGGRGSMWGGLLVSFPFIFVINYLRSNLENLPGLHLVIFGVAMILVMIFYPGGASAAINGALNWVKARLASRHQG